MTTTAMEFKSSLRPSSINADDYRAHAEACAERDPDESKWARQAAAAIERGPVLALHGLTFTAADQQLLIDLLQRPAFTSVVGCVFCGVALVLPRDRAAAIDGNNFDDPPGACVFVGTPEEFHARHNPSLFPGEVFIVRVPRGELPEPDAVVS